MLLASEKKTSQAADSHFFRSRSRLGLDGLGSLDGFRCLGRGSGGRRRGGFSDDFGRNLDFGHIESSVFRASLVRSEDRSGSKAACSVGAGTARPESRGVRNQTMRPSQHPNQNNEFLAAKNSAANRASDRERARKLPRHVPGVLQLTQPFRASCPSPPCFRARLFFFQ